MTGPPGQGGPGGSQVPQEAGGQSLSPLRGEIATTGQVIISPIEPLPVQKIPPIEGLRFSIAKLLLIAFIALTLAPVVVWGVTSIGSAWFTGSPTPPIGIDDAIRMITAISASMSGLVGAVVGYYFGQKTNDSAD